MPDREFLHDVENWHQQELEQQQAVAPLDAALPGGDDAADVGVGEHDHDPRTEDREKGQAASTGASGPGGEARLTHDRSVPVYRACWSGLRCNCE
jgi:hypothetical protein